MADSSMRNIGAVEQYGKNLANVNQQTQEIFKKVKQQTDQLKAYWDDDMFDKFRQDFDMDIMKKIQEISVKMEVFSKYVEEMCKIHRMAQQQKYY
jgi:uncharacterized protein YukE